MSLLSSIINFINNKKFFFVAVGIFLFPYLLFSFWNMPSADDYMILDKKPIYGFWQLQSWVYHNWTGRYVATFVSSIFSYSGFLYLHYYLHALLLLAFTFFAWLFCLRQINKYFLSNYLSLSTVVLVSLFLLVLELIIIPETVTAFYWFSSAITYQLPLLLMVILIGLIIQLMLGKDKKITFFIPASILIICINGFNESITLFILVTSTILLGYYFITYKKIPKFILALYVISLISSAFLLLAPGIIHRGSLISASPVFTILSIAVIKFSILHWFVFKEPVWWFSVFFLSIFFSNNKHLYGQQFTKFTKPSSAAVLAFYVAGGIIIYFPILYVTNGSLPLRTENILCFLFSLILLLIVSIFISNRVVVSSCTILISRYKYVLLSVLIFSSGNMKKVADTLLSGYFYKQVMAERLDLFERAKSNRQHEVTFDNYETAVDKRLKLYPLLDRRILKDIISKPPPIICFESDLYDINYLKELYGIQKLTIQKKE
ncbi:MAG TPA: DUF6056 family protein [Segetibacter sp.]